MQKLIMLIDDDKDEYFILNQAIQLAELSHLCIWASSSERAEQLLTQVMPDLILIDYNMPVVNGVACLERIRKMDSLNHVPVVMYSNFISEITQELALTKGATCFEKSGSISKLLEYLIKLETQGNVLHSIQ